MIAPIILPAGTEARWHYAGQVDAVDVWDEFAIDLLDDAVREPASRIKDDILMLVLLACERANRCDPALGYNLNLLQAESHAAGICLEAAA